jgi:hypothetical protein
MKFLLDVYPNPPFPPLEKVEPNVCKKLNKFDIFRKKLIYSHFFLKVDI